MQYEQLLGRTPDAGPTIKMNFSISSSPVEVTDVPSNFNFSEHPVESLTDYITQCFSLLERIKLTRMSPKQVLKNRLKEVVRYCKANPVSNIKQNKKIIVRYLSEYVYQIIMDCLSDPAITKINLAMILGLRVILKDMSTVQELQDVLRIAKVQLDGSGAITKSIQSKLSKTYAKFWTEFLYSLEETYFPEEKKGSLVHREKGLFVK